MSYLDDSQTKGSSPAETAARPTAVAFAAAAILAVAALTGCAPKPSVDPMNIVSGDPERDAGAFQASERHLAEVKYSVIEKKGPRPLWDRMGWRAAREQAGSGANPDETDRPATSPVRDRYRDRDRNRRSAADDDEGTDGPIREYVYLQGSAPTPGAPATTQPTTRPADPPPVVIRPSYDEDELPLRIVELPDGKIRLIWSLENYGGSTVTSTRDNGTSRRNVAVAAPDLGPLVTVLQQQLGAAGTVTPLPRENTLVITCDRAMKVPLLEMLYKLDVPPRQVEISAKIFEVSRDFDFQQGAEVLAKRLASDNAQTATSIFQTPNFLDAMKDAAKFQGSIISFMKVFQEAGISVDASIQMLADAGMIKVVSSPRMTVAQGQTGYMLAGQELPIQTSTIANGAINISTQYKPVGVQLYITPQSIGPDRVKLHAISIVSNISGFAPLPKIGGSNPDKMLVNPIIESREAETAVTVFDGDTLVISGLRMSRTTTRENKVPGLGDIPLLGWLFKNHRSQQQLTDLYFFVTPTLL
jgi:hypothetical protein